MELDTGIGSSLFVLACILLGPIVCFVVGDVIQFIAEGIIGIFCQRKDGDR